jgi:NTE family protein
MKTAFVLSGGGAKGAFQIGVMKALADKGVTPDVIYGTSVGALNACGYAYAGLQELEEVWRSLRSKKDILRINWKGLLTLSATGLYNMKPLRKKIEKLIECNSSNIDAWVCVTDLKTGEAFYRKSGTKDFAKMVEASAAIPAAMMPVGKYFVDGGVREMTPLTKAIDDGADKIVVILTSPIRIMAGRWQWKGGLMPVIRIALRSLEIVQHEIYLNDIAVCRSINENIPEGKRYVNLEVYSPHRPLIDTLEFDPAKIAVTIQQGYEAVK